ncbi:Retrovirus-related Pol polyprotein from transposon TNT 1-94 [Melia azedarach]|uniref:Retrovirus-related Pol polyprotein from transposon TNT 1-94 n=1 Tax=Melia azedarach TaxID=155640 RepID=A0ACC1XP05_MELAZ|nr:Retrovirus-related Pol polyprotein from transposon TNT 1-94 [Melia azedarach]
MPNATYTLWKRQDKLLFLAILELLDPLSIPQVSSAKTSAQAWSKLASLYANRSCTFILGLKESLMKLSRGTDSVANYLRSIKGIADDLALGGAPLDNLNLVIHALNDIGPDFIED